MSTKSLIVIPVYNGEAFIERSLKSCLAQTAITDIWVVDNKSLDHTIKIVAEYKRKYSQIRVFINENNLGRIGNWNRCLDLFEKSDYSYIKFLFAGDELYPNCIEEYERIFEINPGIGAIASSYDFAGLDGKVSPDKFIKGNHLYDIKEANIMNIEKGGILGAIVSNIYNKQYINGYRFSEFFVGKADFDYEILSRSKAYYLDKVLTRFNLDAHRTFFKAQDYFIESEFVFNRSYRLEKNKWMFDDKEYRRIKKRIFLEFFSRNLKYYSLTTFLDLIFLIISSLPRKFMHSMRLKIIK